MNQTAVSQKAKVCERIIYVEPNDVFDKDANNSQQGETLTPKYEDFCISFNLIIECFNRLKKKNVIASDINNRVDENGQPRTYEITWGLTQKDLQNRRSSVLQGNRGNGVFNNPDGTFNQPDTDYNFLTTYFTDISYKSYKNTEIEGLGVESVDISYESWYTPTVVIKFVDVRGSALWGREEQVHVDEKLSAENIFGAFFTMPYPLFRLQVKGFLGKPVTYQLACSNFKGEFNAQTGNFEAVATFIGYSWSLLTDIPFTYLVAAPYSNYIGRDYWNRHVNTREWGLWNDGDTLLPPPTLYNLFKNIENAFDKEVGKGTPEQQEELTMMSEERSILTGIKTYVNFFKNSLAGLVDNNYLEVYDADEKRLQLLLFSRQKNIYSISIESNNNYKELCDLIKSYENGGFNKVDITTNKFPNTWTEDEEVPSFNFIRVFNIKTDESSNMITNISLLKSTELTQEKLSDIEFNEKRQKLTSAMSKKLFDEIIDKNNRIKEFCYLVDFSNLFQLCEDRLNEMDKRENEIREEIQEYANINIINLLGGTQENGFKPFIGNVFKVIFCHLETFCHIMFDSANEIYQEIDDGERTPTKLGVNINNSGNGEFLPRSVDITKDQSKNIHPWPAIYDTPKNTEGDYTSEIANVYGWPGDLTQFKNKFREVQVVYGLQEGIQFLKESRDQKQTINNLLGFPITPFDFNIDTKNKVFGGTDISNITDLSGYLALRASSLLGVVSNNNVSNEQSKIMGRMDAYNLYNKYSSITIFTGITKDIDAQTLEDIMLCKESDRYNAYGDKKKKTITNSDGTKSTIEVTRFKFETAPEIRKSLNNKYRHPFFKENSGSEILDYIHFYDEKGITYVPTMLRHFASFQQNTDDSKAGIGTANFVYDRSNVDDLKFIPNYSINGERLESNDWIYTTDSSSVEVVKKNSDKMYINKSMFNIITDKTSVDAIKNKYYEMKNGGLRVEDYEVKDDLSGVLSHFVKIGPDATSKYFNNVQNMLSGDSEKLLLDKEGMFGDNMKKFNYNDWCETEGNKVIVNSEGELLLNNEKTTLSELVIQQFKIYYKGSSNNRGKEYNVFGCPFYYMQNILADECIRIKVKALLFLHTFKYNFNSNNLNIFSSTKRNGITEEVPKGYLLLLGGLLWRKKQENDPIVFSENGGKIKYRRCPKDYSLHRNYQGGLYFSVFNENFNGYNCPISNMTGGITNIDSNIENQLIEMFENFAVNEFNNIANKYELKNNTSADKKTIQYTENGFELDFKVYYNILTTAKNENKTYTTKTFQELIKSTSGTTSLIGNYVAMSVDKDNRNDNCVRLLLNEADTEYQDIFKDLYFGTYIVTDCCYRKQGGGNNTNGVIHVNKQLLKSYLNGFVDACRDITSKETVSIGNEDGLSVSKDVIKNRDLSLAIYYYLKNLWDKWLVISNSNAFDIKPFFFDNFIFTDSFYNNVYHRLAVNCEKLLNAWTELADNGSLFHFLSRICKDEGCIFLPVPDYVGFNGETQKHDIEMMENLFRPLSYNEMSSPTNNNKFVIMYTHSPAHIKDESGGFPTDSYDIWSHETKTITKTAKELFRFQTTNNRNFDRENNHATREGYNVPSFGVAFARQNNHIFKNLKVSMDNPVMTEQAIISQMNIAKKAGNAEHTICFIGQDTFNVFTNYSYSVTLEMMGNAQICPLMYFQLLNIPMWRGTYMIYKVAHNMTPGNMTTTVTAMKMNKYAQPFNSHFFGVNNDKKNDTSEDCYDDSSVVDNGPCDMSNYTSNSKMKKVLSDVTRAVYYTDETVPHEYILGKAGESRTIDGKIKVVGQCTSGPTTWYKKAGVNLVWWKNKDHTTSDYATTRRNFINNGFELVWNGTKDEAIKNLSKTFFKPGDISTLFAYKDKDKRNATSHGAMWTGKDWRSDFIQDDKIWVYSSGSGREGEYSVCIWRRPDFQ